MIDEAEHRENNNSKIVRAVISKEADNVVNEITTTVNNGFEAGRATKLDVTSFMIIWFKEHINDDIIQNIRLHVANDLTMLDSIIKKAKVSGSLPPELKEVLAQYFFGQGLSATKKVKKSLKPDGITDRHKDGEAA
jgi:hypothetical protein